MIIDSKVDFGIMLCAVISSDVNHKNYWKGKVGHRSSIILMYASQKKAILNLQAQTIIAFALSEICNEL